MGIFLAALVVLDLLPAFSMYSVRTTPRVDVLFHVSVGGGELHVLLCCHLDSLSLLDKIITEK